MREGEKSTVEPTEEEWEEMARKEEKEMRKKGTYYNSKYEKGDEVQLKLKGWEEFKPGTVQKVHKHKKRSMVKYDIKLYKKYQKKNTLYKNIFK